MCPRETTVSLKIHIYTLTRKICVCFIVLEQSQIFLQNKLYMYLEGSIWRRQWHPTPVLAWKIPWTEEPGRVQPMGLLGVGHD